MYRAATIRSPKPCTGELLGIVPGAGKKMEWVFKTFVDLPTNTVDFPYPIGSMYAIYNNIYHQYTPNVSIYTIHGSYGYVYIEPRPNPALCPGFLCKQLRRHEDSRATWSKFSRARVALPPFGSCVLSPLRGPEKPEAVGQAPSHFTLMVDLLSGLLIDTQSENKWNK